MHGNSISHNLLELVVPMNALCMPGGIVDELSKTIMIEAAEYSAEKEDNNRWW
jgi:hypothetical protein